MTAPSTPAAPPAIRITHAARQYPSISPVTLVKTFFQHRDLIAQMTKREVVGRYKGSALGLLWSFFNPLLMLAVYTFAFSVVFKAKWPHQSSQIDFALNVFVGLIPFTVFAESISRAPTLILSHTSYVKKVIFPLDVLPWVSVLSAVVHAIISTGVLLVAAAIFHRGLPWTIILLPVAYIPLVFMTMGFAWFLASLGVYIRDVAQTIGIITMMLMYLAPVFYSLDNPGNPMSRKLQVLIRLNPLTVPIECARDTLNGAIAGAPLLPHWHDLPFYFAGSLLVAWLGFAWFQRTKRGFADVL